MQNIYTKKKKNNGIFSDVFSDKRTNVKRDISLKVTKTCIEKLSKELDEFVVSLSHSLIQEK